LTFIRSIHPSDLSPVASTARRAAAVVTRAIYPRLGPHAVRHGILIYGSIWAMAPLASYRTTYAIDCAHRSPTPGAAAAADEIGSHSLLLRLR